MIESFIDLGGTNPTQNPRDHASPGDAEPRLPKRIGRYTIVRRIGRGGMGAVYEAVQDSPHRTVALKVMSSLLDTPSAPRRFAQESEMLGRLDHPCIAKVFEAGTAETPDGHVAYITMEFIAGAIPITEHAKIKRLDTRERLALFAEVCDALHHAHDHGIVHRDIKPTNILIDSFDRARVIDFGVARSLYSEQAPTQLRTSAGEMVGTLEYMSPEQCGGNPEELDRRADVYSLGVLLYELLTGRLPYDLSRADVARAVAIILAAPPIPPTRYRKELKGDLETILLKALQKEPERRYQTAADLGGDVRRFLAGEPIVARRDSRVYVVNRRARSLAATRPLGSSLTLAVLFAATLALGAGLLIDLFPSAQGAFHMLIDTFGPSIEPDEPGPRNIRVIRIEDDTDFEKIAADENTPNVSNTVPVTWRAAYGRMLDRLAAAGAKVVMFDIDFPQSEPRFEEFTARFARGVEDFSSPGSRGRPVQVALDWEFGGDQTVGTLVDEAFRRHIRPGGATGAGMSKSQFLYDLAVYRNGLYLPSLVAAAWAEYWHPTIDAGCYLSADGKSLMLPLADYNPSTGKHDPRPVLVMTQETPTKDHCANLGFYSDDKLMRIYIDFPSKEYLLHDSKPLNEVMSAPSDELSRWAAGKIIVVANFRSDNPDNANDTLAKDRKFNGVEGQIAAADAIDRRRFYRDIRILEEFVVILAAVTAGVLAGWLSNRSKWLGIVLGLVLTAAVIFVSVYVFTHWRVIVSPLVFWVAVMIGCLIGWWVGSQRASMCRDVRFGPVFVR